MRRTIMLVTAATVMFIGCGSAGAPSSGSPTAGSSSIAPPLSSEIGVCRAGVADAVRVAVGVGVRRPSAGRGR